MTRPSATTALFVKPRVNINRLRREAETAELSVRTIGPAGDPNRFVVADRHGRFFRGSAGECLAFVDGYKAGLVRERTRP